MKTPKNTAPRAKARSDKPAGNGQRSPETSVIELAPVRFHIRKILVPIDFSKPSQTALRYARPFAEQFGASLTLLHVMEPIDYPVEYGYAPIAPMEAEETRQGELLARLKQLGTELGTTVPVKSIVRVGRAWKEIVDVAQSQGTDLVIVATHGYTGLKHALLGSVAEKVVRHAPCPALVVRTEEHDFL
jgi:universal stress protein A